MGVRQGQSAERRAHDESVVERREQTADAPHDLVSVSDHPLDCLLPLDVGDIFRLLLRLRHRNNGKVSTTLLAWVGASTEQGDRAPLSRSVPANVASI